MHITFNINIFNINIIQRELKDTQYHVNVTLGLFRFSKVMNHINIGLPK